MSVCSLTREDFARAPSDGDQILDQVLAVGGLAAAGLAQQHNGLILTGGKQVAVRRLSHGVDMRSRVLTPAAFEHVHHLMGEKQREQEKIGTAGEENKRRTSTKAKIIYIYDISTSMTGGLQALSTYTKTFLCEFDAR